MAMKVLLATKFSQIEPLGLLYLSTTLYRENIEHEIFLYDEPRELLPLIDKFDVFGISIYSGSHMKVFHITDVLREKGKFVILGGAHATYFCEQCLEHADAVVVGEGFKHVGEIIKNKSVGRLHHPLADKSELPVELYREKLYKDKRFLNNRIKNVMCSINCPYNCSYCYNSQYRKLYKNFKVRLRNPQDVVTECESLKKYPLDLIFFQDDYFGYNLNWLREFSLGYKINVHMPFHCQMRPDGVDEVRLGLLREAGCISITMAIECANDDVRVNLLRRNMSAEKMLNAAKLIKEFGFKLRTEQMLGLPKTTLDDELKLLEWNMAIKTDIAWVSTFVPYRGTDLGEWCVEHGLYDGNNDDLYESFWGKSLLNFSEKRKREIEVLQHLFSIFACIPEGHLLAREYLKKPELDFGRLFNETRKHLYDEVLYKVREDKAEVG